MIRGQTISLVPLDQRHLEKTRLWANDAELARLMDRARPVNEAEHERWYRSLAERGDCLYFAIETTDDARHVGNVWLADIDWRHRKAELRVVVGDREAHGRGLGSEAISLMCVWAFERLNLHRIFAFVLATNPRGRRAFEKAGFVLEGTLQDDRWADDRYVDAHLLARLR